MNLNVSITEDTATPAIAALMDRVQPERLAQLLRPPLEELWNFKLKNLPPNKRFPGSSTGFWERQADTVKAYASGSMIRLTAGTGEGALVQRRYGGPITATNKALTIPAREEYYGRSATEFQNLKMIFFKSGAMALVEADAVTIDRKKQKVKGAQVSSFAARTGGLVAYWVIGKGQSTRPQAPNPNVVPSEDEILEVAFAEIERRIK
jgi:hypothetical protein